MTTTTAEDDLARRVAEELAGPEPAVHFGVTLLVATVVASPVLGAAALGTRTVPMALALYLAVLVGAWFLVGLVGGVFALVARPEPEPDVESEPDPDPPLDDHAETAAAPGPGSPAPVEESVGLSGAH